MISQKRVRSIRKWVRKYPFSKFIAGWSRALTLTLGEFWFIAASINLYVLIESE
jgi:hypothetical protein